MSSSSAKDLKIKFTNMKVGDLRQELGELGLDRQGIKAVLVERLLAHYDTAPKDIGDDDLDGNLIIETDDGEDVEITLTSEGGKVSEVSVVEDAEADHEQDVQMTEAVVENERSETEVVTTEVVEEEVDVEEDPEQETEKTLSGKTTQEVDVDSTQEVDEDEESKQEEEEEDTEKIEETTEQEKEEAPAAVAKETEEVEASVETEDVDMEEEQTINNVEQQENNQVIKEGQEDVSEKPVEKKAETSNNTSEISKDDHIQDNKVTEGDSLDTTKVKEKEGERCIILVTGLSSTTSANDLKTYFRKFGKIGRIKIMTNTRVPGSQRFAHISVNSLDELNHLVTTLDGVELKGRIIRVIKAPDDGSVSSSYEIAVATAMEQEDGGEIAEVQENGKVAEGTGDTGDVVVIEKKDTVKKDGEDDVQVIQETSSSAKKTTENKVENTEKKQESKKQSDSEKKSPEKARRTSSKLTHRSRKESHEKGRRGEGFRPQNRGFRRDQNSVSTEWRRHGPPRGPMEITRVHRDRPPMGRGHPANAGGRRRSPHAQLTFEQIRDIRDEQRRRDVERRKREEERERTAEVERQKRLEYQNYMEFKTLEREREKLRMERERIEKEKLELFKLERERQKAERERIEKEKEELRRAKMNIEHSHQRPVGMKRPYEVDKDCRRELESRKKPYAAAERPRPDLKADIERKVDRVRYDRERTHSVRAPEGRGRSPPASRDISRDPWARGERVVASRSATRTLTPERSHRRESTTSFLQDIMKGTDRRSREAPLRTTTGSSEALTRYAHETPHSSARSVSTTKRYDEVRPSTRETEWLPRSSYLSASSSLSMPMSSSAAGSRDSWPMTERKLEAWDTSRLAPRTEQWISGSGTPLGGAGRSSLPVVPPPPPIYSHTAAPLELPSTLGLGNYTQDRYDGYKGSFLRRF